MPKDNGMNNTAHHPELPARHRRPPVSPWALRAWPTVLWQAHQALGLRLQHLSTDITCSSEPHAPCRGQTLWAGDGRGREAGLAWDWVQITPGVVTLADPMSVITNLRLLGGRGQVLTALEAARYLNDIVHRLPWQTQVAQALRGTVQ